MYNGYNVADIQTKLQNAGFDPGGIDGIYGGKTTAAVRAYQTSKGLSSDGVVGNNTWTALNSPGPSPLGNMSHIASAPAQAPAGFNEAEYLAANPDVAKAVQAGWFSSGLQHYQQKGINEGRAGNSMQQLYNTYQQKASQAQPTEAQLREQAGRAAGLQMDPVIEQLKRQREQDTLNFNNQTAEVNNNYADTATDLQKVFDNARQSATNSVFGRGLGRSGLLDKQIFGYDTEQANQLGKSDREKNMKLAEIGSQSGLTTRQSGEQEQQLLARKTALEAQTYTDLAKQARQEGNDSLARLFDMANGLASRNASDLQSQLEESWRQKDYQFKQDQAAQQNQQAAQDLALKQQQLALSQQKASSGGGVSVTQQKYDQANKAATEVNSRIGVFRTPGDLLSQLRREYGASNPYYQQMEQVIRQTYPNPNIVLKTWNR